MKIEKVYISGKISGLPVQEAIAKFKAAAAKIRRFGFEPVSPLDNGLPAEADWTEHMGRDITLLLRSDAIYLLADYEESEGALIELCVALQRRMPVLVERETRRKLNTFKTLEDYGKEEA